MCTHRVLCIPTELPFCIPPLVVGYDITAASFFFFESWLEKATFSPSLPSPFLPRTCAADCRLGNKIAPRAKVFRYVRVAMFRFIASYVVALVVPTAMYTTVAVVGVVSGSDFCFVCFITLLIPNFSFAKISVGEQLSVIFLKEKNSWRSCADFIVQYLA